MSKIRIVTEEYRRPIFETALARARAPRKFIQVLAGPRQAGKTTLARQVLEDAGLPSHYATADDPVGRESAWIETQWELARVQTEDSESGAILVLDEAQKVPGWSEVVKRLWDEDSAERRRLKVFLLGSAPLLVQRGLTESLAGRFELIRVSHWSLEEMRQAFGWDIDRYLYFGGYPGAAELAEDERRWRDYILDSLVETTISRDILLLSRVDKPALLRQLFRLACTYSGQVLSYNKMLGQLQDAGNTTTLAHYLELLSGAGMVTGLQKYSGAEVRRRGSSPKLVVLNTALMTATSGLTYAEAKRDKAFWGRLVETAVGGHLLNAQLEAFYWRDGNLEVDYVARRGKTVVGFEVGSERRKDRLPGLAEFSRRHRPRRTLLVGAGGIPVGDFLREPGDRWLQR